MSESDPQPAAEARLTRAYLSDVVGAARRRFGIPAIAVSVMNATAILLQEIQGVRTAGRPDRATLDDLFHIGSCAKSVLALMAARQVEQAKIAWRTRFFDMFPELEAAADGAYRDITLEDLLLCEAGIKAYTNSTAEPFPEYGPAVADKRLAFIGHLLARPPSSERTNGGFRHLYSNASYAMAAAMLERVSGLAYEDLVRRTLRDDLGLSVHIGWPGGAGGDQPWGHVVGNGKVEALAPDQLDRIPCLITPAGDLSMSPRDYARYTQLHLRGLTGGAAYISGESYRHIHFARDGFALGVANGVAGGKRFSGFDGSAGSFFCRSIIVPQADFAFAIMTNAGAGSGEMKAVDWLTMRIVRKRFSWWWKFWL